MGPRTLPELWSNLQPLCDTVTGLPISIDATGGTTPAVVGQALLNHLIMRYGYEIQPFSDDVTIEFPRSQDSLAGDIYITL